MYQKILVGTDGSGTAALAVDRAVEVARAAGAGLTIFCAARREKASEIVAAEAARHESSGVAIETDVAEGEPVGALIEACRVGGYDLLVLGNRGMTGVARFLRLGSVPNKVSHHLPCSVLIVKTT
ncbi:MAG TPA: universal stress protein [Acidimicrobiales bacterium]|nr:universal stress protein [Acidimicrobiales bacterium]